MKKYQRWNPCHWVIAFFSNSRKVDYTPPFPNDIMAKCGDKNTAAGIRLCYWFRNPAHDLTHYILGFVDPEDENKTDPGFRTVYGDPINTSTPGLIVALRMYKWLPLPYFAYWGHGWKTYFGWRPDGGLGFKIRRE